MGAEARAKQARRKRGSTRTKQGLTAGNRREPHTRRPCGFAPRPSAAELLHSQLNKIKFLFKVGRRTVDSRQIDESAREIARDRTPGSCGLTHGWLVLAACRCCRRSMACSKNFYFEPFDESSALLYISSSPLYLQMESLPSSSTLLNVSACCTFALKSVDLSRLHL